MESICKRFLVSSFRAFIYKMTSSILMKLHFCDVLYIRTFMWYPSWGNSSEHSLFDFHLYSPYLLSGWTVFHSTYLRTLPTNLPFEQNQNTGPINLQIDMHIKARQTYNIVLRQELHRFSVQPNLKNKYPKF